MKAKNKYILITGFLIVIPFLGAYSQAPDIEWQKSLGGSQYEVSRMIKITSDNGYIVIGHSNSNNGDLTVNNGSFDIWVTKLSPTGELEWQKSYGGPGQDLGYDIIITSDNGYILVGTSDGVGGDVTSNYGEFDIWVIKIDASGTIQWQKSYGGGLNDLGTGILQISDGGYVIGGYTRSNNLDVTINHGDDDFWLFKVNSIGELEWQKTYGGSSFDNARSIKQTSDGGYILAGKTQSNDGDVSGHHGGADYWVIKVDAVGNLQWQNALGGFQDETATSVCLTNDGGYMLVGETRSLGGDVSDYNGLGDLWAVKLNAMGILQWQKCHGGSNFDSALFVYPTTDGNFITAGYTLSNDIDVGGNHGGGDLWIVKFDEIGDILWQKPMGGTQMDYGYAIEPTPDNGFIVTGFSKSNDSDVSGNHGIEDVWIIKLGPETLGFNDNDFANRIGIYPTLATDYFKVFNNSNVHLETIDVYNLHGKNVFTFHFQNTTDNEVIDISSLESGVYLLKINSKYGYSIKKLIKK